MIEVVTNSYALADLRPAWDDLWRRVPIKTPFQSPAWILPWWRHFGTERPVVAIARDEQRLLGILPTYVLEEVGCNKLLPMGVGLSDYFDALIAPDAPADIAARLLAAMLDQVDVPVCDLPDLLPGATLLGVAKPCGWDVAAHAGEPCPVLALNSGASLDDVVPAKTRRKLRMNRHRAERIGGWTTRIADASTLAKDFDALIRLHGARWQQQGQSGVLADPRVLAFHRDSAPALLDADLLRLTTLHVQGTVAAVCLAYAAPPDRLLCYLSGFDEAFASVSPGTLLLGDMVEAAMRDGLREVHFLRGSEAYKYAWGGVDQHNTTRHFSRATR